MSAAKAGRTKRQTKPKSVSKRQRQTSNRATKSINIALQGGGAHGAFSWGVLDRLLEDGRLDFEGLSGTSAGAMNAVVLAHGYVDGGHEGARKSLHDFWHAVSQHAQHSPVQRTPFDVYFDNWSLDHNPAYLMFDMMTRLVSPYEFNPLNLNPLRDVIVEQVDFTKVQQCRDLKLFISATNVHTGRVKVFTGDEISADAVMASACLPFIYQAVEVNDVPYWDGGFMGNPVLYPFLKTCTTPDILLVQINPTKRIETPRSARDILNRMNEISFNSSLLKELRLMEFVNRCLARGDLKDLPYREIYMHHIEGGSEISELSSSSKLNAEWPFLCHLRDIGRAVTDNWLNENFEGIGNMATFDVVPELDGDADEYLADSWPALPDL